MHREAGIRVAVCTLIESQLPQRNWNPQHIYYVQHKGGGRGWGMGELGSLLGGPYGCTHWLQLSWRRKSQLMVNLLLIHTQTRGRSDNFKTDPSKFPKCLNHWFHVTNVQLLFHLLVSFIKSFWFSDVCNCMSFILGPLFYFLPVLFCSYGSVI